MPGRPNKTEVGDIPHDKFIQVLGDQKASVSMTVGFSLSYGEAKVSATVHLTCGQDEAMINEAGERAFYKAHELATDGLNLICEGLEKRIQGQG